jgi:AcrR family transcriptional regulator
MTALTTRTMPRQARSAKSLELILDTAEQLFHERGVAETSTVDLAAAAEVSIGRLYYWFPDKEAVVRAVLRRCEERLREFLRATIVDNPDSPTPDLLRHLVPLLGQFFKQHPGSLAVLMRGPVDIDDVGEPLCQLFVEMAAGVVRQRVPGIPDEECMLVANAIVRIVLGMLAEYVTADEAWAPHVLDELVYILAAYLHCRYPGHRDPVWTSETDPIRPSRRPQRFDSPPERVYPALTPHL